MADKLNSDAPSAKKAQSQRPSIVSIPTSSRTKTIPKEKNSVNRSKKTQDISTKPNLTDLDEKYREMAYSQFVSDVLNDCVVKEKIVREETPIEMLMTELADRFRKTVDQLDKTSRRLNGISFAVEQKRLSELKQHDSTKFYKMADDFNKEKSLAELPNEKAFQENALLSVNFGLDKNSGHKQLLDTVNDAIEGLEKIKKESNLDSHKFRVFDHNAEDIDEDKSKFDVESVKSEFEVMFPKLSSQLLQEASEKIVKMIESDYDEDDTDDD